jgi:hypothetical protein
MCPKCQTDCKTFGECIRAKGLRVGFCRSAAGIDRTMDTRVKKELELYASARRQGIQPAGTKTSQIRHALDASDKSGVAYNAGE